MSITIRFLRERGDLRWRAIECVLVFTMFLNQIMVTFIEFVIKSNITILKILSMFCLSMNNQEIAPGPINYTI